MKMTSVELIRGKIAAMRATEPKYAYHFLNDAQNPSTEWDCVEDMIDSCDVFDVEPPEPPEVRRGRWNRNEAALDYVEPDGAEHHHGICSECGLIYDFGERKHWYNFCPNCGAKMDLPVNGGAQE